MASVTLQGIYLARVADLGTILRLNAGVELASGTQVGGEFRAYAGGRVRLTTTGLRSLALPITARRIDRVTRETLDDWAGQLLLLRDGRGRKAYGSYLAPSFTERPGLPVCDMSLTFVQVTRTEEV